METRKDFAEWTFDVGIITFREKRNEEFWTKEVCFYLVST
jgi:hypothetical protein